MNDKKKKILLGILFFVMLLTWYIVLDAPKSLMPNTEKNHSEKKVSEKDPGILYDSSIKVLLAKYKANSSKQFVSSSSNEAKRFDLNELKNYRDPFNFARHESAKDVPASKKKMKKPIKQTPLILQGIIWDSAKPCAIINDEIVYRGDFILGYYIKEVKRNRVILLKDNIEKVLWVPEEGQ